MKENSFQIGQVVKAVSARYEAKQTTPPERYTQDTLLDAMITAHRFAKSDADRVILRQTEGLGTSRTRVAIISNLIARNLLTSTRKGKRHELRPTETARTLCQVLPPMLKDVAMTAMWEKAFAMVEKGEVDWRQVVDRQYAFVHQVVEHGKGQVGKIKISSPVQVKASASRH
jgi:DNA topoisomerase-3